MTNVLYIILIVLTALAVWAITSLLRLRKRLTEQEQRTDEQSQKAEQSKEQYLQAERDLAVSRSLQQQLQQQLHEGAEKLSEKETQLLAALEQKAALESKLESQAKFIEEERERGRQSAEQLKSSEEILRQQFKNLASDILSEQTKSFKQENREQVEGLLKPFRDNITDFRERVEKIYSIEAEQHGALKNELSRLLELNSKITSETSALTRALKGDSKVQGDYGEMILDTILSASNLVKGVHYTVQESIKGESGENLRPDVILNLPDRKQIVIDSKTSLTAYSEYMREEDYQLRQSLLKEHIESVKKHIAELCKKNYQELLNASPDFVIMFIPNEPAFLAAQQAAPELWSDAYKKKVIISSPSNIFALLKLVDNLWQRNDLERNTREIAECGSRMHDQLVAIIEALGDLDKSLGQARKSYDETLKRMTSGNNNLVRLGAHMEKLNIKFKKSLPQNVVDIADTNIELSETLPKDEKDLE